MLDPKRIASSLTSAVSAREEREAMEARELERLLGLAQGSDTAQVRVASVAEMVVRLARRPVLIEHER